MSSLPDAKILLLGFSGLSKDALHIYVGLAVLLGTALLLRWPLRRGWPLLAVLAAALAGEVWDLANMLQSGAKPLLADSGHDIVNTMAWPLAITLMARFSSVLSRR